MSEALRKQPAHEDAARRLQLVDLLARGALRAARARAPLSKDAEAPRPEPLGTRGGRHE